MLGGLVHSRNVPRFLGVLVGFIYCGGKELGPESMLGMVWVGGYNNSQKCLFSLTIRGANYTFSRDFDFSATVIVKFHMLLKCCEVTDSFDNGCFLSLRGT